MTPGGVVLVCVGAPVAVGAVIATGFGLWYVGLPAAVAGGAGIGGGIGLIVRARKTRDVAKRIELSLGGSLDGAGLRIGAAVGPEGILLSMRWAL